MWSEPRQSLAGRAWALLGLFYNLTPSLAGMILAVLLYQGHLPRLFQRNLFYRQKNKYRTPRGKLSPGSVATQTPTKE